MANEIWKSYDEAYTLYALIWRQADDKVYDAGSAAFDTYTDDDIDDYDIPLTNHADSDYHSVDFPSVAAGIYRVQVFHQVGGSIDADDDVVIGEGEIYWDGSAEMNPVSLDTILDTIAGDVVNIDGIVPATAANVTSAHATTNALINTVDGIVDAILVDTDATIPALIAALENISVDDIFDDVIEGTLTFEQAVMTSLEILMRLLRLMELEPPITQEILRKALTEDHRTQY